MIPRGASVAAVEAWADTATEADLLEAIAYLRSLLRPELVTVWDARRGARPLVEAVQN